MADSWLIMWGGDVGDAVVAEAILAASASHAEAHEVRFDEIGGPRRAILLVHYDEGERDRFLARVEDEWEFGYVNAVTEIS